MFHFFRKAGTVKELDRIIAELNMNMQNNYKDAAQDAQNTVLRSWMISYLHDLYFTT